MKKQTNRQIDIKKENRGHSHHWYHWIPEWEQSNINVVPSDCVTHTVISGNYLFGQIAWTNVKYVSFRSNVYSNVGRGRDGVFCVYQLFMTSQLLYVISSPLVVKFHKF